MADDLILTLDDDDTILYADGDETALVDDIPYAQHYGYVIGPDGSTDGNVAVFDGTTGRVLKDGGFSADDVNGKADKSAAISDITRSGTTFTATRADGTTFTFTQKDSDTKNTAGSTNTSSKIFLIGATSQAASPQTYSHETAYVGTDGCLYSDSKKVLTEHQDISGKLDASLKGAVNGLAELDANGKVPTAQLPSYVDDVLEYASLSAFPATGETGKIYVALDTNLTYRWSGSAYTEISPSLALGETSSTAYRGDRGADAYAHAVTNKGNAFSSGLYKITTNSEGHVTTASAVEKSDITALGIPEQDTTYSDATQSDSGLMSATDKTKLDGITRTNALIWYATCSTAAATRQKDITISEMTERVVGDIIVVKFTNGQTYNGAPRLKVNSFGYATIRRVDGTSASRYEWQDGEAIIFVWDGTYYQICNFGYATTTYFGRIKLSNNYRTENTSLAATSTAVYNATMNGDKAAANIAPKYDASVVYNEGDYCTYYAVEYIRKSWGSDTPAAEAWDETHWETVSPIQTQINTLLKDITWNDL